MALKLVNALTEPPEPTEDVIFLWRYRIFNIIYLCIIFVVLFPYIANVKISINNDQFLNVGIYTFAYFMGIIITFFKGIPFKVRAWIGLFLFFLIGVISLSTLGVYSSGRIWLFTFNILGTLLLGLRSGLIILGINLMTIFIWLRLWALDLFDWPIRLAYSTNDGIVFVSSFLFTNAVATISLGLFVFVLEEKLKKEQSLSLELKQANATLQNENKIRKQMESSLRQAQKMESIGTLAGGIAHDFNNILSPIMIHSELASMALPKDSPQQHNLIQINKSAERARELVKQILTISRKREEDRIPLRLTPILKEVLTMLRSSIPSTVNIVKRFETLNDVVFADLTQINQIIMNLCTNAAYELKEKGGTIKVSLVEEYFNADLSDLHNLPQGPYLKLTVKDDGNGMDEDTQKKIFEPYFTTKPTGEGTGLGLSVVHGIAKSYGGDIRVESERGKGTAIHILLPRTDAVAAQPKETIAELPRGNERILLVDDEKAAIDALKSMLEILGYKVTSRTSSIEGLEAFRYKPDAFDLVITDMTMPNMTGKDLAKEMIYLRPDIPIILCTGYSDQIDSFNATETGIKAYVLKPLVMREFAKTIREVLENIGDKKNIDQI